ncbi:MAG: hypothetical protein KDA41_01615, partial [Planctomycetales bacterium]|nr:hypothetical protein [Planctomycetales bacterium]
MKTQQTIRWPAALIFSAICMWAAAPARAATDDDSRSPKNTASPLMLDLPGTGTDAAAIDYAKLPRLPV